MAACLIFACIVNLSAVDLNRDWHPALDYVERHVRSGPSPANVARMFR